MLFLGLLTSNVRYITTSLYFTPTRGVKTKYSKNLSPSSTEERKTPERDREDQSPHCTQNENSNLSEGMNTAPTTQFPPGTQNQTPLNPSQNSFVNSLEDQGTNQMNSSAQIFESRYVDLINFLPKYLNYNLQSYKYIQIIRIII